MAALVRVKQCAAMGDVRRRLIQEKERTPGPIRERVLSRPKGGLTKSPRGSRMNPSPHPSMPVSGPSASQPLPFLGLRVQPRLRQFVAWRSCVPCGIVPECLAEAKRCSECSASRDLLTSSW